MAEVIMRAAARAACHLIVWVGFAVAAVHGHAEQTLSPDRGNNAFNDASTRAVHLYFADSQNDHLKAEMRVLGSSVTEPAFGAEVTGELLKGPGPALVRTIPAATELRALYYTGDGTAYVDLSEAVRQNHPGGVQSELLTVYAIVNTLVLNLEDVARVQILIEGETVQTLAGHIDISRPLTANLLLVR